MKIKSIHLFSLLFLGAATLFSCKKAPSVEKENPSQQGSQYVVDTENSRVEWTGYKVLNAENSSHFGTIKFTEGQLSVQEGKVVEGEFTLDMKTISDEDLSDPDEKAQLDAWLKSADFFDVNSYPEASFEITEVQPNEKGDFNSTIRGNLTIKGIAQPIEINANISVEESVVTIKSDRTDIDRTNFGINYNLPPDEGIIKNNMTLQVKLSAYSK